VSYPFLSDLVREVTGYNVPLPLPMFGLLVGLAMLVASEALRRELRRLHRAGEIGPALSCVKNEGGVLAEATIHPEAIVPDLVIAVFISGIVGARLFHILEHADEFMASPWSMIFTRSGLSIFGGLTFGILAGILCVKRWRLPLRPMLDAVAPAMMLGYAIGRVGCQVSGDGDWGIPADLALKPGWLPTWLWAQTYDHNIFGAVIPAPGVFPAPIYETLICIGCFALLWALRMHPYRRGWLFGLYLVLAGVERVLIEQIRVNPVFDFGVVRATQAEVISVAFVVAGVVVMARLGRRRPVIAGIDAHLVG
jgi:phosphatidylglycerol---prolipoprotein diacylglyceryl transferase